MEGCPICEKVKNAKEIDGCCSVVFEKEAIQVNDNDSLAKVVTKFTVCVSKEHKSLSIEEHFPTISKLLKFDARSGAIQLFDEVPGHEGYTIIRSAAVGSGKSKAGS